MRDGGSASSEGWQLGAVKHQESAGAVEAARGTTDEATRGAGEEAGTVKASDATRQKGEGAGAADTWLGAGSDDAGGTRATLVKF